ncbi:MAG: anti-sigma factor antagonist [Frankiales bacterium]|nr:anti-sigma factor antagonist [Frankiales bacterium]
MFQAQLLIGDGYAVISLSGELDLGTVPTLRAVLEQVNDAGLQLVVIDAAELDFIDSSGLGACVGAHKTLVPLGARLVIANLPSRLYRPVRVTGLSTVIPTHVTDEPTAPWTGRTSPAEILAALGFDAGMATAAAAPDGVTPTH